jgi:hypothetical protein
VTFGVLVFLILTPILVLFTRGYEIDWKTRTFVKTGVFVVRTLPTKAQVYINNKKINGVTPETIRFLLPGNYDVSVQKADYQTWTKKLHITAQFATWINEGRDFITLFFSQPKNAKTIPASNPTVSNDGTELIYADAGQIKSYSVGNLDEDKLGATTDLTSRINFGPNLTWQKAGQTFDLLKSIENLPLDAKAISKAQTDGKQIVFVANGSLYTISDEVPLMIDKDVSGFTLDGDSVWYVTGTALKQYNLSSNNSVTAINTLPISATSQVIRGGGKSFLVLNNSLYTINDFLEKIYDNVVFVNFDNDANKMLFGNFNEILTYDSQKKTTELILRSISQVLNPVINSYTGYVFFVNEGKIKAIELDGRDHRNIYTILSINQDTDKYILSRDGLNLTIFSSSQITSYRIR